MNIITTHVVHRNSFSRFLINSETNASELIGSQTQTQNSYLRLSLYIYTGLCEDIALKRNADNEIYSGNS